MIHIREAEQFLLSVSNLPRKEYMKDPKKCDIYLKRMRFFLDILGNPEDRIPHYIHVGGTSGKGSVVNNLHGILAAAGLRVGSTISPHPSDIYERWRVGNTTMTQKEFVEIVEEIKPALDEYARAAPYGVPSFFELTSAIAFLYFAKKGVEWAVIEVGCGGRYDSANILKKKDVAIITNIGLDHTEILGDTKEKIAWEKAGIIKPGCTAFTMEASKKIRAVIEKECKQYGVPLRRPDSTHHILESQLSGTRFRYKKTEYAIPAIGEHQIKNAILCIEVAKSIGISKKAIVSGLKKTKQPLRMEPVSDRPLTILDGAHNRDKIKTTVAATQNIMKNRAAGELHLVVGFSANKDIHGMLKALAKLSPASVACTRNTINPFRKVADPADLANTMKKLLPHSNIQIFLDPKDAFIWSKKQTKKKDILLATGSLFLSGELKKYLPRLSQT
jgi:dihydrofolate synthase/folylpolyglutamate synthase